MRTRKIPLGARHLRTFTELQSYLIDFVAGLYTFLWIVGRPGTGKTELVNAAMRGQRIYYRKSGQVTPLQFYKDCYQYRGMPIILDDCEHLLRNQIGAKLISALADTSRVKQLCYGTTGRVLGDVPSSFFTTSPLLILANCTTNHEALQSRGPTLVHDPTNIEIHRAVAPWFWDQEIHNWFGEHLYRLSPLDTRWYVFASMDKRAERNWRQLVLKTYCLDRASSVVQDLETDPSCPTSDDKAQRFKELMGTAKGTSRASYFRLRRRLEDEQRLVPEMVPPIQVGRSKPPGVPSVLELESMESPWSALPEEEPFPIDVPSREQFAQPIRGQGPTQSPRPPQILDDSLPWERPTRPDEEDGEP